MRGGLMQVARRNTELGLVLLAGLITVGGYVLATLGTNASLPANLLPFLLIILGLLAGAHLATRTFAPGADGILLPLAGLLNGIGYIFIARLDRDLAGLQALWTGVGIGAFILTLSAVRRARDLERFRYTFALVGVGLLLIPLLPVLGQNINGARLWVRLGPMSFQPGELAKIALCVFFASYLVEKAELLSVARLRIGPIPFPDLKHYGPLLLMWGVSLVVMIFERDLGSSLLFFALFIVLLWVATGRAAYLLVGGVLFTAGAWISYSSFSHVKEQIGRAHV
jgi:cell division protein FtsW (lipid II flippase)